MLEPNPKPPEIENVSDSVREPPEFDYKALQWNSEGFAWRTALVRAPKDLTAADLQNYPEKLWKKVQGNPATALRRWDRLTILASDESWMIPDAIVAEAAKGRVVLTNFKILTLQARTERFATDDGLYVIEWEGAGFACFRVAPPGQPLIPLSLGYYDNIEAAKAAMFRSVYPKRV